MTNGGPSHRLLAAMRMMVGAIGMMYLVGCSGSGASGSDGPTKLDSGGGSDVAGMDVVDDRAGSVDTNANPDHAGSGGATPGTGGSGGDKPDGGGSAGSGGAFGGGGAGGLVADAGVERDVGSPGMDGGATSTCLGTCLETFLQQCPKIGQSCTTSMMGTDIITCYANGVKQLASSAAADAPRTVRKANGETCYTSVGGGSGSTQTIRDPLGNVVAELMFNSVSIVTVFCMNDMKVVDLLAPPCAAYAGAQACVAGTCSW